MEKLGEAPVGLRGHNTCQRKARNRARERLGSREASAEGGGALAATVSHHNRELEPCKEPPKVPKRARHLHNNKLSATCHHSHGFEQRASCTASKAWVKLPVPVAIVEAEGASEAWLKLHVTMVSSCGRVGGVGESACGDGGIRGRW